MRAVSNPVENNLPARADRLVRLPPYGFALIAQQVHALTAAGHNVIRLDVGSPDLPPPEHVIATLNRSAANPAHHGYGNYQGDPTFRRAVAGYYQRRFGVALDPDREVLPLIGSKEGLVNLMLAYIDRGDCVIAPDVNYPAYALGATLAGGEVIRLRLDPATGYAPDLDLLARHPDLSRAKILWINYPNNPTGACVGLDVYTRLVEFCREHRLLLCSDNPYSEIVFDGYQAPSALQADPEKTVTVEFMSLSKTYNMAGWRLGACVGNRAALEALLVVKSNIDSGHFRAIYDAGTAALDETPQSWIDARNAIYAARRNRILAACPRLGLQPRSARGSLYIWAGVPGGDDQAWTARALQEAHVSITPGQLFGEAGKGYVRIAVTVPDARLDEALRRLERWQG